MPRVSFPVGPSARLLSPGFQIFRNPEDPMESRKGAVSSIQGYQYAELQLRRLTPVLTHTEQATNLISSTRCAIGCKLEKQKRVKCTQESWQKHLAGFLGGNTTLPKQLLEKRIDRQMIDRYIINRQINVSTSQ